jgi:UbiD family decarboxylase
MREYMEQLRARGQLLEVRREVQARHELAAVTQAAQRRYDRPILFHRVSGTRLPVLTNVYGSRERLAEILGIAPADFCRQWNQLATVGQAAAVELKRAVPMPADLVDARLGELPLLTTPSATRRRTSPRRSIWPGSPRPASRTCRSTARCT